MKIHPLKELTDVKLFELVREDNGKAFSQLFDRYWEVLLDTAIKILKDTDIAQDCVQEVFTDLWKKRSLVIIYSLRSYLLQSVRYKAIDQIRSKRIPFSELDNVDNFIYTNCTQEWMEYREMQGLLDRSIAELPDQCKRVFRMSRYESMSNREIAQHLNLSVRTVENHIAHALRLLRLKIGSAPVLLLLLLLQG